MMEPTERLDVSSLNFPGKPAELEKRLRWGGNLISGTNSHADESTVLLIQGHLKKYPTDVEHFISRGPISHG